MNPVIGGISMLIYRTGKVPTPIMNIVSMLSSGIIELFHIHESEQPCSNNWVSVLE